jgi:hypothetical protein
MFVAASAFGQNVSAQSDPAALSLARQAYNRLTGNVAISDITLSGTAVRFAGKQEQDGTFTLQARGTRSSRAELQFFGTTRTDIRADASGLPSGAWSISNGVLHPIEQFNCWTDASWFFPTLGVLGTTGDSTLQAVYIGAETRNGISVQHLQFSRVFPKSKPTSAEAMKKQSTIDMYLDGVTLLPVAESFHQFPDNGVDVTIIVEIRFGNYQPFEGAQVPMRIQKLLNGSLVADMTVTSVQINSGLPDSLFSLQ